MVVKIVVISLDRRPDRWNTCLGYIQRAGLEDRVQKLSAVDAKAFSMNACDHPSISLLTAHNIKHSVRRSHYEIDSAGAIGCSLSHFKAWSEFISPSSASASASALIVFEDDVAIPADFNERLSKLLTELPPDGQWDMVTFVNTKFAGGERACSADPAHPPWYTCQSLLGTHAYMVSRQGAKKLLDRAYPIEMHVDAYIAFMARMGYITMNWYPGLDIQPVFDDSDIQHGGGSILNVPTDMESNQVYALSLPTIMGLLLMAGIAGGLVTLAWPSVRKRLL